MKNKSMRILFEVTHPKHAHLFRHAMVECIQQGHTIAVTAREKDVTLRLLDAWREQIGDVQVLSQQGPKGMFGLAKELVIRDWRLFHVCRKFKPDLIVARVGPSAAHCGRLLGIPVVVFEDTDDARLQQWISFPLATHVCTSRHYAKSWGQKHIRYDSFDEMAYLHPNRFTPDLSIAEEAGLQPGRYIVVRCVSWQASHDVRQHGFGKNSLTEFIERLNRFLPVVITSETTLPSVLKSYQLKVAPEEFHHILAGARLTVGESSTVATEGAMLGVPGVLINTMHWSSINRLVTEYGLIHQTTDLDRALECVDQWLNDPDHGSRTREKHQRLLAENVDLTQWMLSFFQQVCNLNQPNGR